LVWIVWIALYAVSTASDNTAIGAKSLLSCTDGINSCFGVNSGSLIITGTGDIGVGAALGSYDNTVSDNIYIGNGTSTTDSGVLGSII